MHDVVFAAFQPIERLLQGLVLLTFLPENLALICMSSIAPSAVPLIQQFPQFGEFF